jgi:hypothetical protein
MSNEAAFRTIESARAGNRFLWVSIEGVRYDGFLLDATPACVLIKRVEEFVALGYALFRRDMIEDVDLDEPNIAFADGILRSEGLGPSNADPHLDLSSMSAALAGLQQRASMISAQRRSDKHDDRDDILLGEISAVDDLRLRVRHVSTTGERDRFVTEMLVNEIALVEFDSPYLRLFQKHARDA